MATINKYREVEEKYPISNRATVIQALLLIGGKKVGNAQLQEDRYFVPAHKNYLEGEIVSEWLRVRVEPDKASFNYKCWQPIGALKQTHCDEFETSVGNAEALLKLLNAVGFREIVTVRKERETFEIEDFEVAFDSVRNLGDFIEVECRSDSDDVAGLHDRIKELLCKLGAALGQQDHRGYPYQMLKLEAG